ncbi:LysR family transcriptional regulator [Microbacterium lacus]|uniref:LysR family transcriptional regulator n=1 Tax=Microbacterium lacus TaxID=415217 RepID=UPI00384DCA0D
MTSSSLEGQGSAGDYGLGRVNLNLLLILDSLLAEASVTRAGSRLHMSQPTVSGALAKLRAHFSDPLLIRRGNTYELTPLAMHLSTLTPAALAAARDVFSGGAAWIPAESEREFVIYGDEHTFAVVAPELLRLTRETAPKVNFRFARHSAVDAQEAVSVLRSGDALVMPHSFLGQSDELMFMDLWQDDWVMLIADDNPAVADGDLEPHHVHSLPWVVTHLTRRAIPTSILHSQGFGVYPRVVATVDSSLAVPHLIAGSDRIAIIQTSLAAHAHAVPGVRVCPPPFVATPLTNAMWWHRAHTIREDNQWLRRTFDEVGRAIERRLR